jgi:GntR family phosphonate transport system transcriptional regulator
LSDTDERTSELSRNGISLWRQISESIVSDIKSGAITGGARLPADIEIADRFGVNRHTVRRAMSHLESEGIVRIERGRGTFVIEDALKYRLGSNTRFSRNLLENQRNPNRKFIALELLEASKTVATSLDIATGKPVILLTVLGEADGVPISFGRNYFPLSRCRGLEEVLRQQVEKSSRKLSITAALASIGIENYRRKTTKISARMPNVEEARHLKMAESRPILETESIDVSAQGHPITYARTSFRADLLNLVLET